MSAHPRSVAAARPPVLILPCSHGLALWAALGAAGCDDGDVKISGDQVGDDRSPEGGGPEAPGADSGDSGACAGTAGGSACERYVEAIVGCYDEAGMDVSTLGITDNYCDLYEGVSLYDPYFECYISAIEAADCSTTVGVNALSAEAAGCVPG